MCHVLSPPCYKELDPDVLSLQLYPENRNRTVGLGAIASLPERVQCGTSIMRQASLSCKEMYCGSRPAFGLKSKKYLLILAAALPLVHCELGAVLCACV